MGAILAIDQGTHASRVVVFDAEGAVLNRAEIAVSLQRLDADTVEQDASEILSSLRLLIKKIVATTAVDISVAALATQRSTLVAWDKISGEPLAPAISWQDRRSAELLKTYADAKKQIHAITGLPLSPHYLAGKIRWLLENNTDVISAMQDGRLAIGPLSSFLCFHLLENHPYVIDHSNAGRSLLFDLCRRTWSEELLKLFALPISLLPACKPVLADYGRIRDTAIQLKCVCGDQNAAIHSQGKPDPQSAMINIGTGAFVLQIQGDDCLQIPGLLSGIASSDEEHACYLLEGTVNGAGAALDELQAKWSGIDIFQQLPGWLNTVKQPPIYINGVGGLGSPWWIEHLQSRFIPESLDCAEQAVAVIESIVFLLQYNLEQFSSRPPGNIILSGGLARLDGICQRMANISGLPVRRSEDIEATARGAAWLSLCSDASWQTTSEARLFTPVEERRLMQRYQQFIHELERYR